MMRARRRCRGEHVDHPRRNDKIAKAERREEYGIEASREDHAPALIKTLQRGNGTADIAILAIVVVFKDQYARLSGPLQKRKPSPQTHR